MSLVAGNAVVMKPPTQGCVSGLHMAECFRAAGVPPGLVNVVTGRGSEIGDYLTARGFETQSTKSVDLVSSLARST